MLFCSWLFVKHSQLEKSVIDISDGVFCSITVLFYVFHFDVWVFGSTISFSTHKLLCNKGKLTNMIGGIIFFGYNNRSGRIVSYHARNNWECCHNFLLNGQIIEYLIVIFPFRKSLRKCYLCAHGIFARFSDPNIWFF